MLSSLALKALWIASCHASMPSFETIRMNSDEIPYSDSIDWFAMLETSASHSLCDLPVVYVSIHTMPESKYKSVVE
jgi:hypothetical protein